MLSAEPATKVPDTNAFRAPTVGLEDMIFTIGTSADAAKFEVVKEELGKHFATQSWNDGVDAAQAFDKLIEPSYEQPEEPEFPSKMVLDAEGKSTGVEDPEYDAKVARYRMRVTKYSRCDAEYEKLVKN